ncbi:MAG TPA: hypothetical protein VFZ66_29280 [Herpetosiphonaceae bacterium]
MPSKKQSARRGKPVIRRQVPQPTIESDLEHDQQIDAATIRQAMRDPGGLAPQTTLHLQRAMGNQAVGRLLAGAGPQPGQPGEVSVQRSPATSTQVIQRGKGPTKPDTRPARASSAAHIYFAGQSWHCRDFGKHWVYNETTESWRIVKQSKAALHNRVDFTVRTGRGAPRGASFKMRMGSAASYADPRASKFSRGQAGTVKYQGKKKRTYRKNMQAATGHASATTYAAANGAPVIAGGYNWCHLIGHGGGGSDAASNLVAASTHANSEHLLIERIVYQYKNKDVVVEHSYEPFNGATIAKSMLYKVSYQGKVIFERLVDGFRAEKPSGVELAVIEVKLTSALSKALDES